MYLALLNEEQKKLFLNLAFDIAVSDGDYNDKEKSMISSYCQEMQITLVQDGMDIPIEELLRTLNAVCDEKVKKIIVFESIGLVMADNNYADDERKIVDQMENVFGLPLNFAMKCESILNDYISFQQKINQLILE